MRRSSSRLDRSSLERLLSRASPSAFPPLDLLLKADGLDVTSRPSQIELSLVSLFPSALCTLCTLFHPTTSQTQHRKHDQARRPEGRRPRHVRRRTFSPLPAAPLDLARDLDLSPPPFIAPRTDASISIHTCAAGTTVVDNPAGLSRLSSPSMTRSRPRAARRFPARAVSRANPRFLSPCRFKVIDAQVFIAAAEDPAVELKADSGVSFRRFSERAAESRLARCGCRRRQSAVSGLGPCTEQSTDSANTQ